MFTENLGRQIKKLNLPGLRIPISIRGQSPLTPFKEWLFLVFLIFLEILIAFYLLNGLVSRTQTWLQDSKEVRLLQNKLREIEKNYQFLQSKQTLTEDLLESLKGSNSQLIENVSLAASLSQMTLTGLSFGSPENSLKPELLQRRVELDLTGSYEDLLIFLERINQESPPLVVSELVISLSEKKGPVGQIEAKVSLVTYYRKEAARHESPAPAF